MKIVWFLRVLVNFEGNGSTSCNSLKKCEKKTVHKVIKFEDCEIINQRFAKEIMEKLSTRNQYLAAMAGKMT